MFGAREEWHLTEWLQEINRVDYDVGKDAEAINLYMKYKDEKFLSSKKHETALFLKRYT